MSKKYQLDIELWEDIKTRKLRNIRFACGKHYSFVGWANDAERIDTPVPIIKCNLCGEKIMAYNFSFVTSDWRGTTTIIRELEHMYCRCGEIKKQKEIIPRRKDGHIYFVQAVNGGPIKIGYSENVLKRLSTLQTAFPYKLEVLLQINGTVNDERALHKQFNRVRLNGEWFEPDTAILNKIKELSQKCKAV